MAFQMRDLHLAVVALSATAFLLYFVCMTVSPQAETAVSPVRRYANHNIKLESFAMRNSTVEAVHVLWSWPKFSTSLLKPTQGTIAGEIYEAGFMDNNSQICPAKGEGIKLLVIVISAPVHDGARMAIRETWGHYALRRDIAIAFLIGSTLDDSISNSLEMEQYLFSDIVRGKCLDTYDNLTLKTISMVEWVGTYCSKADFVLKTDDDMFINIGKLLKFIFRYNPEYRLIYGHLARKWPPARMNESKYYVSMKEYKYSVYPDFTVGPAYLFPARISMQLYVAALNYTYFKLEDVFLTGFVAESLHIKRFAAPEFFRKKAFVNVCSVHRFISIHMVKETEQYDLWKKAHTNISNIIC